jgi:hypothetical protein
MTDSTTAEDWLTKSKFSEVGKNPSQALVQIKAAQEQATLFIFLGIKSYNQWFNKDSNEVSDALSCGNDRGDEELTFFSYLLPVTDSKSF